MGVRTILATTFSTVFMFAAATQATTAASWLEMNFWMSGPRYDGNLPACDDASALGKISGRFAQKESTFWVSDLAITGFDKVREIALRPWGHDAIPRRYCSARVALSNGRASTVFYSIAEDQGFIGASWGVEWCVQGYDRNMAYAPNCKMAQP